MDPAIEGSLPDISLFQAIMQRRTCRDFTQEPVEFEKIAQIIQAGMEAPSSGNLQNWQFILITEKEKLRTLFNHTLNQESFNSAQVGIIVCSDNDIAEKYYGLRGKRLYSIQNCAACIQNMLLAAHAFGLGASWVGAFDEEKVDSMFDIPPHARAQAILLLGYPATEPEAKEKKSIDHLLYFNKYGEKIAQPHLVLRDYSEEWEKQLGKIKTVVQEKKTAFIEEREAQKEAEEQSGVVKRDFFQEARDKMTLALDNLKDEEKQKK